MVPMSIVFVYFHVLLKKELETKTCDILVIGGGLSGCLVTLQLLKQQPGAKVCMIEKKAENLARGIAYAQHFTGQLLNVPVAGMSVDPQKPEHFYNWLTTYASKYPSLVFDAQSFVPRSIYGDYVEEQFKMAIAGAGDRFSLIFDETVQFEKSGGRVIVTCKQNGKVSARYMVLATGNLPPADISIQNTSFLQSSLYVSNPWTPGVISKLEAHKDVLIIGSGLTAIDLVLALQDQQHSGKISLLSKRKKLPLPHAPAVPYIFPQPEGLLSGQVKTIFLCIRKAVRTAAAQGIPWQSVMDSLRPWTQKAWMNLDEEQKSIFLLRWRPYWEIHRHRVPQGSLQTIEKMKASGQLEHFRGKVDNVLEEDNKADVLYSSKNRTGRIKADLVINCTGPENNFRKNNLPLLIDMMKKGYVISDELNMGIACNQEGKVIDEKHRPDEQVYCMGHLRKGTLWETTAVRELREQAYEIAKQVRL